MVYKVEISPPVPKFPTLSTGNPTIQHGNNKESLNDGTDYLKYIPSKPKKKILLEALLT